MKKWSEEVSMSDDKDTVAEKKFKSETLLEHLRSIDFCYCSLKYSLELYIFFFFNVINKGKTK